MRKLTSSDILLKIMRGEEIRPGKSQVNLGDSFWQYFVPSNQQVAGQNEIVFRQNLSTITQKLGFNPFTRKCKTFVLADTLSDLELQQMLLWLAHLDYEEFELPTENYESPIFRGPSRVLKLRYNHWHSPFENCFNGKDSFLSLATDNADFVIPVLPHLRVKHLSVHISSSPESYAISEQQFEQLGRVLGTVKTLRQLRISSYTSRRPLSFFENLNGTYPFTLILKGSFPAEEWAHLARALKANSAIFSLELNLSSGSEGIPDFIAQLGATHLRRLKIHESSVFGGNNFKLLTASLPPSLETLEVTYCDLEDADCEDLIPKLPTSKLQVLNLAGNKLKNFGESLGAILNRTSIVSLNFDRNDGLSSIKEISKALMQPDCRLQALHISECHINQGCRSLPDVVRMNSSLHTLSIHALWGFFHDPNRDTIIANFYKSLLKSMSRNFNIREGGFHEGGFHYDDGKFRPSDHFGQFLKRNLRLYEAQNLLEKCRSGKLKQDKILEDVIPNKLEEAMEISRRLMAAYPEAHLACETLCNKIREECKGLNSRNVAALKLQGFFRSTLESWSDGNQARALFSIKKYEQDLLDYCRENDAYDVLEAFAQNMKKKDYISAAEIIRASLVADPHP